MVIIISRVTKIGSFDASDAALTRVTTMGNIIETMTMQCCTSGSPCRKIDVDHYLDTRDGSVNEYDHGSTRADSLGGIRNTMARIRSLVNTNVTDTNRVRWVTLTYAENMTDTKQLYKDYDKYWKRFKYWCKSNDVLAPEYINVIEPQGRGAWHIHAFLIWEGKAPYIENDVLRALWGKGFVSIKAITNCDNVGAYFSAYLGDMPVDEWSNLSDEEKERYTETVSKSFTNAQGLKKDKRFVKGGRLGLYPVGMNIVRTSRGVKRPEVDYMTLAEAKEKASEATETFRCVYQIAAEDGSIANTISKVYYNTRRSACKD